MALKRRYTKQRQIILDLLKHRCDHPTADDIFSEARRYAPNISLGTVYRNLEVLRQEGFVRVITVPGQSRRYDGNTTNHHHIRCSVCGAVEDLPAHALPEITSINVPGFKVSGWKLEIEGVCSRCRSTNP